MTLKKTVIGSFPNLPMNIFDAIRTILNVQVESGIDIVSDGEQRADMITYFEEIPGFIRSPRGLTIDSRINPPENPSELTKVKDFLFSRNCLTELGKGDIPLKTAITGPITLGLTCAAAGFRHYSGLNDKHLYYDLSNALESIIIRLFELGSYVQLDEPGLSAGYMPPSEALPILGDLFDHVSTSKKTYGSLSIHVCGNLRRIPKLLEGLLELDVDIISLGFSGPTEQENVGLLSEHLFENSGKKLGVGCMKPSAVQVEDVEDTERTYLRIKSIVEKVGKGNVAYAHPDCGLKGTSKEISELILSRLSQAVDRYNLEL